MKQTEPPGAGQSRDIDIYTEAAAELTGNKRVRRAGRRDNRKQNNQETKPGSYCRLINIGSTWLYW